MSDNLLLDTQIFEKDELIKKLKEKIEQLEMEKKIWQDKIFSQAQSVSDDMKQTQSIIQQIQMTDKFQFGDVYDSRIEDSLQHELKKKEDSFCPQCKELYFSINRSIHNSFEQKKLSMDAKIDRIKYLDSLVIEQKKLNQQAVEIIQSKEIVILSKNMEIKQHLTNLQACKKYISSMEKK